MIVVSRNRSWNVSEQFIIIQLYVPIAQAWFINKTRNFFKHSVINYVAKAFIKDTYVQSNETFPKGTTGKSYIFTLK